MTGIKLDRKTKLFILLGSFFVTNAIIAEFIGVKIFSLEQTLGIDKFDISILGFEHLSFELTCGVILWPVVFIMTDIINEYYGKDGVRRLSYIAAGMIAYSFVMVFMAIGSTPAEWWLSSGSVNKVDNMQNAYKSIFGQGLWIIIGSLVAFLVGQLVDVYVFHWLKVNSNEKYLWLRSTGSTLVSQLIDSYVVLFIAFKIGGNWPVSQVLAIGTMNYIYKFIVAFALTPVIYFLHNRIDQYLGKELSDKMIHSADQQYDSKA